jgi:acyl phosphate:glycerol-3-phosphate acyltransferase
MDEAILIKSIIVFIICYLIGSIPIAYILVKLKSQKDITKEGSGNVGTLNSFTVTKSKTVGITVLLLDILKGALPVYLMLFQFDFAYFAAMFGACGIILGHNFPVWLKFKGGRGLAPGAGIFLVTNYFIVIGWCIVWLLVFAIKKKVLISNTAATFSLPFLVLLVNVLPWMIIGQGIQGFTLTYFTVFSIIITLVILVRHKEVFSSNKTA